MWGRHTRPTLQVASPAVLSKFERDPLFGESSDAPDLACSGVGHPCRLASIKNFSGVLPLCTLRRPRQWVGSTRRYEVQFTGPGRLAQRAQRSKRICRMSFRPVPRKTLHFCSVGRTSVERMLSFGRCIFTQCTECCHPTAVVNRFDSCPMCAGHRKFWLD